MKLKNDRRGFSLVELIITMGIMSIVAVVTVGAAGYLNAGKTKKASAKLNSKLAYIQTETMTKEGCCYLYLYKKPDGVYYYVSNKDAHGNVGTTGLVSAAELDSVSSSGTKICDSKVDVTLTTAANATVKLGDLNAASGSEVDMYKIGYDKATGAFSKDCATYRGGTKLTADFYNKITLSGKQTFSIKLVEKTGKHHVAK